MLNPTKHTHRRQSVNMNDNQGTQFIIDCYTFFLSLRSLYEKETMLMHARKTGERSL